MSSMLDCPLKVLENFMATAFCVGGECAWPRRDALAVIEWLSNKGVAVDGIEVWLPLDTGRPEIPSPYLYAWLAEQQENEESWMHFVARVNGAAREYVSGFDWDEEDSVYRGREPFFNISCSVGEDTK